MCRRFARLVFASPLVLLLVSVTAIAQATPPRYHAADVGTFGGTITSGTDLNELG